MNLMMPKVTRALQLGIAGVLAFAVVTILLWLVDVLSNAAQVTAYATAVLAAGTVGLATGAIGTYIEQRRTNRQQVTEIERQANELERGRINEMAQVRLERYMGDLNYGTVRVRNRAPRAIRNVYVWIDVAGSRRYHLAVKSTSEGANVDTVARGMENVPRGAAGGDVYWRMRTILPGDELVFEQIRFMHDGQPITVMSGDSDITAWAEFEGIDGRWWRCNEDGEVDYAPPTAPARAQPHPLQGQRFGTSPSG